MLHFILLDSTLIDTTDFADAAQELPGFFSKLFNEFVNWGTAFLPNLIIAILIFAVGWWLSKVITSIVKKTLLKGKAELAAVTFICSFLKCALRVIIIISAIAQLGVNVTSLLTAIGAATITVGLALQDTMSNIASGILIIINKPFKVGDFLELENVNGTVTKIEITNTYLNTGDNKQVIIPNKKLTASNLINYTSTGTRRIDLTFSIGYGDNLVKAKKIIRNIILQQKLVFQDHEPVIGVKSLDDSAVCIDVKVWCKTEDYWTIYYDMQEKVKYMFEENGITIPFNQLVIHKASSTA
ncbi:mechanosensitive ion channel protein MscS [Clostridia bacterium]|nr:mechanosensitive ion channel protein MscS [Clostridia bacterium]